MINKLKRIHFTGIKRKKTFTRPTASITDLYIKYTHNPVKRPDHISLVSCCFHSEHTPSLALYPKTNSFFCFGCQKSGDAITFIMLMENCNYKTAIDILNTL